MFRYIALMWDASCPALRPVIDELLQRVDAVAPIFARKFDVEGLLVFAADSTEALKATPLHGNAGIVVGEIFERAQDSDSQAPTSHARFLEKASREVLDSQGRALTSAYWGNYVAFVRVLSGRTTWVVKDPSGSLPCNFVLYRGVRIFFSCLADCYDLAIPRFTVNWSFACASAVNGLYDTITNPLVEVTCVYRGECCQFDQAGSCVSRCFYWHPMRFLGTEIRLESLEAAQRALHGTVCSVVHSLAASHTHVLQQTSGGLDSSIVLGCLCSAPNKPEVTCYTDYVLDAPSDERRWARYATAGTGCRHIEVCRDPRQLNFSELPPLQPSVEPASSFTQWLTGPMERRLATQYRATATLTGEGGDATFGSTAYVLAVDASLKRFGLGRRTLKTAALAAARRDRTIWRVLSDALRRQLFGAPLREHYRQMESVGQLVSSEAKTLAMRIDRVPNPWFASQSSVPLEWLARLGTLAFRPSFYDLSTSQREAAPVTLSPLCAQPVVEVAGRIPLDLHFSDGRIRGLARRAFASEVPIPILRRQWKDRPYSQVGSVVQNNLRFIREALLDGILVKERILDSVAVESALSGEPGRSRAMGGEILRHLDLELWIRRSS